MKHILLPITFLLLLIPLVQSCGAESEDKPKENTSSHIFTDKDEAYVISIFCDCMSERNNTPACEKEVQTVLNEMSETYELKDDAKRELFKLAGEWVRKGC